MTARIIRFPTERTNGPIVKQAETWIDEMFKLADPDVPDYEKDVLLNWLNVEPRNEADND